MVDENSQGKEQRQPDAEDENLKGEGSGFRYHELNEIADHGDLLANELGFIMGAVFGGPVYDVNHSICYGQRGDHFVYA
jgi:hypothetical protein